MTVPLPAPVAMLIDRVEVQDLLVSYATALDARDWPSVRDLFTDDARADFTNAYGIAAEVDEFVDWLAGQVTRELAPETQHFVTNPRVAITGDTATGSAEFFNPDVLNGPDGTQFLLVNGGRYHFDARRHDGQWRLSRLDGVILWSQRGELTTFET